MESRELEGDNSRVSLSASRPDSLPARDTASAFEAMLHLPHHFAGEAALSHRNIVLQSNIWKRTVE